MTSLYHLWFSYFVPSFWGNGPEAIAQTVLYGLIALAVIPPFRHWFERHIKSLHEKLDIAHEKGDEMTKKMDERFRAIHEKMDAQHLAHMDALNRPVNVTTSIPPTKSVKKKVVKQVAKKAAPVKKAMKR
jgi:hypothetical protein